VTRLILLDSGPLGLATNPRDSEESRACKTWLRATLAAGVRVMIPEIADYEIRRELFRAGQRGSLNRLDNLARQIGLLPITTATWHRAAELWAFSKNNGLSTADDKALDGDMLLAAQAQLAAEDGALVTVATTNVGHLGRFVDAQSWESITG
jgi:hypothetical protein